MDNALDTIRTALSPEATPEQREAGATACRAVLAQLHPSPTPQTSASGLTPEAVAQLASMVSTLRAVPMTQLLDVAIAKLRAALPEGTTVPAPTVRFRMPPLATRPGHAT